MQNHRWPWAAMSLALVVVLAVLTPVLMSIQTPEPPPLTRLNIGPGSQDHSAADALNADGKRLPHPGRIKAVTVEPNTQEANEAGRYWALVVGVGQYPFAPLRYTVSDARLIARTLIDQGYSPDRVVVLTDDPSDRSRQPTKRQVEDRLIAMASRTRPDDTLLFYFSGHGVRFGNAGYLVPIDAEIPLDASQLIALEELKAIMHSAAAEKRLMILDACYSGSSKSIAVVGERRALDGNVWASSNLAGVLPTGDGMISIGSSDENQLSYEAHWRQQGLFTYWFARGLKGEADIDGDGLINVFEAYLYTSARVRLEASNKLEQIQEPRFTGTVSGLLYLTPPSVSQVRLRSLDLAFDAPYESAPPVPSVGPITTPSATAEPSPTPALEEPAVEDSSWPSAPLAGDQARNSLGMTLAFVPKGTFTMGDVGDALPYPTSVSLQTIELTRDFWIGTTEVTVGQFLRFLNDRAGVSPLWLKLSSPSLPVVRQETVWVPRDASSSKALDYPMTHVTWDGAQAFLVWLSALEGRLYTLPTEAQWEYAARAGSDRPFHFPAPWDAAVASDTTRHANLDYRQVDPTFPKPFREGDVMPVASFGPNGWGLFDMHGNVREWCLDYVVPTGLFREHLAYPSSGPRSRIVRGGGWADGPHESHAFAKEQLHPQIGSDEVGFRVVALYD